MLNSYSARNNAFDFQSLLLCDSIKQYYWLILGANGLISFVRIIYLYLIIKAYKTAKNLFNEEEKKRRRKEKFDQNRKNKDCFNALRKIWLTPTKSKTPDVLFKAKKM